MRKILLVSHGEMAKGAVNSLTIFVPDAQQKVTAICAYTPDCPNPQDAIKAFFDSISADDEVIAMSDVLFGSVNQYLLPYLSRPHTHIFAGFNFPMLLQLMALPQKESLDDLHQLVQEGKDGIVYLNEYRFSTDDIDDD
ncbi:MAG: hypothetical protein PUA95_06865 [Lactimicrobium massiliense]|jgi:PTS system mannose-specific IIA component|nr:hypothetical protein [Lactimicrobium massiliense]MDD6230437.1 hypothetical protein [Lactimicrobium massiliense]MDD6457591.1 hypothetical protein [Lactimicrobium massiliense]MDD6559517.1 hypothetical protein [Lactimicrobium massiliense]MDD6726252.1 hypothetical protein [Lactimicrobium massiliense]